MQKIIMSSLVVFMVILNIVFSQNASTSGKRYYFKMGKNNNEFKVHDRIYFLNHNISDYNYNYGRESNRKVEAAVEKIRDIPSTSTESVIWNEFSTHYLDDEWDYDHDVSPNPAALPLFIHKFYDKQTADSPTQRILFNTNRNTSSKIIKFNLHSLKYEEDVLDADMYFYWPLKNSSKLFKESVVLRLYQIEKPLNFDYNESNLIKNPDIHKLFNVIYVSKAQKGWQTFKIKKPMDNWNNGDVNLGLLLTISSYDDNKLIEIFNDTNGGAFSTFAVIKVQSNVTLPDSNNSSSLDVYNSSSSCQKTEWNVDFEPLGWNKFIISPHGFPASECTGSCANFDDDETNHAKLLQILNKRRPCCVPTNYVPLTIMYYDRFDNVVIKNYPDMVVKECGCR